MVSLVKVLLDKGGNPNAQTLKVDNPGGNLPAELLTDSETVPVSQQTPLHLALLNGNSDIVNVFLQFKCEFQRIFIFVKFHYSSRTVQDTPTALSFSPALGCRS